MQINSQSPSRPNHPEGIRGRLSELAGDESGSSLAEFGLAATLFFTVVFGVFSFSLLMYTYFFVSDAAREGSRYAMVRGSSWASDCTAPGDADCIAQTSDIQTYVRNATLSGVDPSKVSVNTTWLTSSGGSCGTGDACKAPGNLVKVQVTYSYPVTLPLVPQQTIGLSSTSQSIITH